MKKKWLKCWGRAKASYGLLENFRKRHETMFNELCGEAGDDCEQTVADWASNIKVFVLKET